MSQLRRGQTGHARNRPWNRRRLVLTLPSTMSILQFLRLLYGTFDDAATKVMGDAFDWVCAGLRLDDPARARVAASIIAAANRGERDPIRLREVGLATIRR